MDSDFYGELIRKGELVAFPTETVYGLGANAFDSNAVAKIFVAKRRPADNPLIVHVSSLEKVGAVAQELSPLAEKLFALFTPGPLTILLPKNETIPYVVTAGSPLVGVRIPNHELALQFLDAANVPVAAPSANISGKPSATHHQHVIDAFGEQVPHVILGGATTLGVESTVVLPSNEETITIMRQGAVSKEQLQRAFPTQNILFAGSQDTNRAASPGIKYRHYAPNAQVFVIDNRSRKQEIEAMRFLYEKAREKGLTACVLCSSEVKNQLPLFMKTIVLGSEKRLEEVATQIYSAFLETDSLKIDVLLIQSFPEVGIGSTIMERIRRAAETKE